MGALHKTTAVFLCDPLNFQKQVLHFCLFRVYIYEIFFWGFRWAVNLKFKRKLKTGNALLSNFI